MIKNWAENITIEPREVARPNNRIELANIVSNAHRNNRRVRAIGSAWSFTDCWVGDDILVDTSRLNRIYAFSQGRTAWGHPDPRGGGTAEDSPILIEMLKDEVLSSNRRFAHVEAGVVLADLIKALDEPVVGSGRQSWALPTMGGAAGQTLAGAISTGTHGGDFDGPPIADMVRAIHLIAADGMAHWIERSQPRNITVPDKLLGLHRLAGAFAGLLPENIHYDDELFDATLVSLGRLGVICAYVIEVREQYGLSQKVFWSTWNAIKPHLMSGAIFDGTPTFAGTEGRTWLENHPFHPLRTAKSVGIFLNPYRIDANYDAPNPDRHILVQTQAEAPIFSRSSDGAGGGGLSNAALNGFVTQFEGAHGLDRLRDLVNKVIDALRKSDASPNYKVAHSVLNTTSGDRPPILSFEMVVSTTENRHVRFIDRILEIFDGIFRTEWRRGNEIKFAGGLNMRFTGPTDGFLGMQSPTGVRSAERFCHIEFIIMKELQAQGLGFGAITGVPELPPKVHAGHHNLESESEEWMRRFEQATAEFNVRMHWGQMHRLDRVRVERDYPDTLPRWRRAATRLIAHGNHQTFSNDFSRRCGLEPYTEVLTATSWGPHRYDVFAFDEGGEVLQFWFDGGWNWSRLGNSFKDGQRFIGPLTSTSWGTNRIDLFGLGKDGALLQLWWDGAWHWTDLSRSFPSIFRRDISLLGPLAAAASEQGRIELFGLARGGNIWRFWYDRQGWHARDISNGFSTGERIVGSLAAVSDGSGRIRLLGFGRRGQVLQLRRTGGTVESPVWAWDDLGGTFPPEQVRIAGPLSAVAMGPDRIDVFARTSLGNIVRLSWRGRWSRQEIETEFPGRVRKFGMLQDFGVTASVNDLYQYGSRHCVEDRFVGPISVVSSVGSQHIFGFGESGSLLQLWRSNETGAWVSSDHGRWWDHDEVVGALVIDIRTGDDDLSSGDVLRHGPSHARIYAKLASGEVSLDVVGPWPRFSTNTRTLALPAETLLSSIQAIGIEFTSGGGDISVPDDWKITEVNVSYVGRKRSGRLLYRCGNPLWYFHKNSDRVWEVSLMR